MNRLVVLVLALGLLAAVAAPTAEARHACESEIECTAGHPLSLFCLLDDPAPWSKVFEVLCRASG